jgi:hypothetical protein
LWIRRNQPAGRANPNDVQYRHLFGRLGARMDAAPRRAARIALAASTVAVLAGIVAPSAMADNWRIIQTVSNKSPYEMRLVATTTTEMTRISDKPAAKIAPGQSDQMKVDNGIPGHGVAVVTAYDLFDVRKGPDAYKGMVLVRSGIDCQWRVTVKSLPMCLDYSRYNRADVDSGGAVNVSWYNNGGKPGDGFYTQTDVTSGKQSGSSSAEQDSDDSPPEGAVSEDGDTPNAINWKASATVLNHSDYVLRKRSQWNSEKSQFDPGLPDTIGRRSYGTGAISNSTLMHGPQAVVMYDLIDPATNEYRASVLTIAGVNCTVIVPKIGCVDHGNLGEIVAGGSKRVSGKVTLDTSDSPTNLRVTFDFTQTGLDTGALPGEGHRRADDSNDGNDDDGPDDDRTFG